MTKHNGQERFEWWILERKTFGEISGILNQESDRRPWCQVIVNDPPMMPGNLNSRCRIRYVPFDRCLQDRIYYLDRSRQLETVVAGGIMTQIQWDGQTDTVPGGWEEAVQRAYTDQIEERDSNTLVALLAFTSPRFRGRGMAGTVIDKMIEIARARNFKSFILPLLPPSQFESDKIDVPMKELQTITRDDGLPYDYWIRLHKKKGATILNSSDYSHRFVMTLSDFHKNVSSAPIETSGDSVVMMDRDRVLGSNGKKMHQRIFADIERDIVSFNWGCVWMKYDLN